MLAAGSNFALVSSFVQGLADTLLVQLVGNTYGHARIFSLYSVYREGDMSFDAIMRFKVLDPSMPLEDILGAFVRSLAFEVAVIEPLARRVRQHFGR